MAFANYSFQRDRNYFPDGAYMSPFYNTGLVSIIESVGAGGAQSYLFSIWSHNGRELTQKLVEVISLPTGSPQHILTAWANTMRIIASQKRICSFCRRRLLLPRIDTATHCPTRSRHCSCARSKRR